MITIIKGPAGAGKTTRLYGILLQEAKKHRNQNHILSVPEQFTLSAMRQIMEMSEEKGILNIDVLSFNRLSHRIFESSGADRADVLDDTAKNLLIRQIASEKKDDLKIFGNNLNKQGYVSSVKSVISEFMQYGYGLFDIDGMIEKIRDKEPALACKLSDIRIIYEEFRNKLGKEYTTREELLARAAQEAKKAPFLKDAVLFLDGFTGFTPVQYEFIDSLYEITGQMYVTVTDDGSDDPLFELGRSTMDHLERIAEGDIKIEEPGDGKIVRHKDNPVFAFVGSNIFRRSGKTVEGNGYVDVLMTKSVEEEVKYVLTAVRELTLTKGYRYRDIAIIMGDTTEYAELLKKEAMRCYVPVYVDTTRGIELNPFSRMLKAALTCINEDLSYESVFNLLRTQMTGLTIADIDIAENYIRALKIRGMKKYSSEFTDVYEGLTQEMTDAANRIRERVLELLEPLYAIRKSASARDYTEKLYEMTVSMSAAGYLEDCAKEFEAQGDLVRKMEFDQIYQAIMDLFDRIVSILGDAVMDITEYSGILEAGLSEIKVGTLPPVNDCVSAGDLERSRFNDIKALFFMGLSEKNIPSSSAKGGIISDMDRQFLKDNDYELAPTSIEKAGIEKFYYYMNILKPTQRLYLSFSSLSGDGTLQKPSYFLKETIRLFNDVSIREYDTDVDEKLFCPSDVFAALSQAMGDEDTEKAMLLYSVLSGDPTAGRIVDSRFAVPLDRLSKAAATVLFGQAKLESASELERFAACAYAHYLQYGLRLRERSEFEFEAKDIGIMLHDVLRKYSEELEDKKLTFVNVTDEQSDDILDKVLVQNGNEKLEKLFESSYRNAYMKNRIGRIAHRTVDTLRFQAKQGSFTPSAFEKEFRYEGLKGFIDRVDRYEDGQDVYIDIIDYKSGNKSFDADRVYYGLDLQLVIYMSAAMDIEFRLHGRDGSKVHPAGLFYYHIDDPIVDETPDLSDEDVAVKIYDKLKLSGIVTHDEKIFSAFDREIMDSGRSHVIPVNLKQDGTPDVWSHVLDEEAVRGMIDHTSELISEFREAIGEGVIKREPYELSGKTPCEYCSFAGICDKGKKRKLEKGHGVH